MAVALEETRRHLWIKALIPVTRRTTTLTNSIKQEAGYSSAAKVIIILASKRFAVQTCWVLEAVASAIQLKLTPKIHLTSWNASLSLRAIVFLGCTSLWTLFSENLKPAKRSPCAQTQRRRSLVRLKKCKTLLYTSRKMKSLSRRVLTSQKVFRK